jgi:serine/threonine protein kinase
MSEPNDDSINAPDIDDVPGYTDLTQLHSTGFATTYRARHEDGDSVVALKVISGEHVNAAVRKSLNRYWLIAQRLTGQASVLQVLDSGSTYTGRLYVATRFCENGSLVDLVVAGGALPIEDALNATVPIALALHAAHQLDIHHRAVKPSNILLTAEREPMLADFVTAGLRSDHVTPGGHPPLHTAPEVLSGGEPSARSDIYSLAATIYHLLASRPPFADEGGVAALLLRIMNDGPPMLTRLDVPDRLRAALARALAAEPDARFPDVLAFATQLHRVVVELSLAVRYSTTLIPEAAEDQPVFDVPREPRQAAAPPVQSVQQQFATASRMSTTAELAVSSRPAASPVHAPGHEMDRPSSADPALYEVDTRAGDPHNIDAPDVTVDMPSVQPSLYGRPRSRRRVRTAIAALGLVIVVVLAGASRLAAIATANPDPTAAAPASTGTSASDAQFPVAQSTPSVAPAEMRPVNVIATDDGATVNLRWTLPASAARSNVVVQQEPVASGRGRLTILDPGATSFPVTGLNPTTHYCFLVGVLVSIGTADRPAQVAWSAPVGVRGACTVASP